MGNILMIIGHPYWNASFANRAIVNEFVKQNPDAVVSNLFELYGNGPIDVQAEQAKLIAADTIILQFPIMWYSCPSLMHRWMEEVLTFGFAYGPDGHKLKTKRLIASFTSAGSADMYSRYGSHGMSIDDLMPPFVGTTQFCGMEWKGYVYSGAMMRPYGYTPEQENVILERARFHATRLTGKAKSV